MSTTIYCFICGHSTVAVIRILPGGFTLAAHRHCGHCGSPITVADTSSVRSVAPKPPRTDCSGAGVALAPSPVKESLFDRLFSVGDLDLGGGQFVDANPAERGSERMHSLDHITPIPEAKASEITPFQRRSA